MSTGVDIAVSGEVATLTLNRPEKRNSVTHTMWREIGDSVERLAHDPDVRVLVVRGEGHHFCAGADISGLSGGVEGDYAQDNWRAEEALANFPAPTIAVVRGNCIGGGVSIALACDRRIADTTATFGITPAKLGIVYPSNSLERAVRELGVSNAKRLLFTGDIVDVHAAHELGLVHDIHDADGLDEAVDILVATLLSRSSLTQTATKAMITEISAHGSVSEATRNKWSSVPKASGELDEGIAAFNGKRAPTFPWRRQLS
jgi:enoyl-CoA hydratase/carnithine racemase